MVEVAEKENKQEFVRTIAGIEFVFDGEGFIMGSSLWNEEVLKVMAKEAGIEELSEKQMMVIRFLRKFYQEQGKTPLNHHIKVGTNLSLLELESLFPGGIKYGARRLAGLPNPKGCKRGTPWNIKTG